MDEKISKARILRSDLPPAIIPTGDSRKLVPIQSVSQQYIALENNRPVIEYETSEPHGLTVGDSVQFQDINPSSLNLNVVDPSTGEIVKEGYSLVYSVPTPQTIQVVGTLPDTYVSGGYLIKVAGRYIVRYRVISEDRNRISHWSQTYIVSPKEITDYQQNIEVNVSGSLLSATWDIPEESNIQSFDIYVAWGSGITTEGSNDDVGIYTYQATVSGNFFSMTIPDPNYTRVKIAVQSRTYPRKRWPQLTIAETPTFVDLA